MSDKYIEILRSPIRENPRKVFLTHIRTGREFTFQEIADISAKIATVLAKKGIVKGDKIGIVLPNCPEFIFLYFAFMQAGAIAIPVNINLHPKEIAYILENSDAKAVYYGTTINEEIIQTIDALDGILKFPLEVMGEESSGSKGTSLLGSMEMMKAASGELFPVIQDDDTQLIVYTSGTMGRPKGVMLAYKTTIGNILAMLEMHQVTADYKFYTILPLSYLGGFYNQTLLPFIAGAAIALERMFDTKVVISFWDTVIKHKINAIWLVPSILSLLLQADRKENGVSYCKQGGIKHAFVGTAPLPDALKKKFTSRYAIPLYENYGLSELLWVTTNAPTLPEIMGVGRCLAGVQVHIVDDCGNRLARGMTGEVVVISPYTLQSYYKNEKEVKDPFQNGVFYTGDIGYIDENEYLHITDRKKDIINKGGINISPKEIEDTILQYPGVTDSAVVGIADEVYGEKIVACVMVNGEVRESDIKTHCRENLAVFKIPQKVLFLDSFPRGVTGKTQKNKLKEMVEVQDKR